MAVAGLGGAALLLIFFWRPAPKETETADVKFAISMDKTVDASDIDVDTDPATKIVTLKGTVASAEQKARAEAIAVREATGFRVVNQLVVKRKTD